MSESRSTGEMQMEEKTLPWWRRALSYALGGIRTGFGLFARSPKNGAAHEDEIAADQNENPEEELTEHSPSLQPVVEPAQEVQQSPAPEQFAEEAPSLGAPPEEDNQEQNLGPSDQPLVHADESAGVGPLEAPHETAPASAPEEQSPLAAAGLSEPEEATIEAALLRSRRPRKPSSPSLYPRPSRFQPYRNRDRKPRLWLNRRTRPYRKTSRPCRKTQRKKAQLRSKLPGSPRPSPKLPPEKSANEETAHESEAVLPEPDQQAEPAEPAPGIQEPEAPLHTETSVEPAAIQNPTPARGFGFRVGCFIRRIE